MGQDTRPFFVVPSADGTPIATATYGDGDALVIVGGALSDRAAMTPLAEVLAGRFSTVAFDRRGRGDSGDSEQYAVEREIEDLAAVIEAIGGSALVYGHSSGGALALRAAVAGVPMTRLALYEPAYLPDARGTPLGATLRALVTKGDLASALEEFFENGLGLSRDSVERAKTRPNWDAMVSLAHTLLYDMAVSGADGTAPMPPIDTIAIPVLVLDGGQSRSGALAMAKVVADAIPGARHATIADQQHNPAIEAIVPVLTGFFTTPPR